MEDAVSDARQFLNTCYAAFPDVSDDQKALTINPPLDAGEAEDFLSGLQSGLFSVNLDGYIQSEVLAAAPTNKNRQKIVQLLWHGKDKRFLFREGVCQLAAATTA